MSRFVAIVPAAGSGARFGQRVPKQYRALHGQPLLHHAIAVLCAESRIEQTVVALAPEDDWFARYDWSQFGRKLLPLKCGGATRSQTVRNALAAFTDRAADEDWILVHDAARPCLRSEELTRLIDELADNDTGGLLATPVADTLKRADVAGCVIATESRESLWLAQTPQMFRRALLMNALSRADENVTDEAGAVEALGLQPRLVLGNPMNVKVTYPQDFALAEAIFAMRSRAQT